MAAFMVTCDEIKVEDDGHAKIATLVTEKISDPIFFRIQSWNEEGTTHEELDDLIQEGSRYKITVEKL